MAKDYAQMAADERQRDEYRRQREYYQEQHRMRVQDMTMRERITDFMLMVQLWLAKMMEKLAEKFPHLGKKLSLLEKQVDEIKQNADDAYWLAGVDYSRIEKLNDQLSDVTGMMMAMLGKDDLTDKEISVLADKLCRINDDIAKDKTRYAEMIDIIDETMEQEGKWALTTLPNGIKAVVDLEHAGDKDYNGTSVSLIGTFGRVQQFRNLDDMVKNFGQSGMMVDGRPIETMDIRELTIEENLEKVGSIKNVSNKWMQDMFQTLMDEQDSDRAKVIAEKVISGEISQDSFKKMWSKSYADILKENGIKPVDARNALLAAELKANYPANDVQIVGKDENEPPYAYIGSKDNPMGLRVDFDMSGSITGVRVLDDVHKSHNGENILKIKDNVVSINYNDLTEQQQAYIPQLAQGLPLEHREIIRDYVKEVEQVKAQYPKMSPSPEKEADVTEIEKNLYSIIRQQDERAKNVSISRHDNFVTVAAEDGTKISATTDKAGNVMYYRDDDGLRNGRSEDFLADVKANLIQYKGQNLVTPEKEQSWAENAAVAKLLELHKESPRHLTNPVVLHDVEHPYELDAVSGSEYRSVDKVRTLCGISQECIGDILKDDACTREDVERALDVINTTNDILSSIPNPSNEMLLVMENNFKWNKEALNELHEKLTEVTMESDGVSIKPTEAVVYEAVSAEAVSTSEVTAAITDPQIVQIVTEEVMARTDAAVKNAQATRENEKDGQEIE